MKHDNTHPELGRKRPSPDMIAACACLALLLLVGIAFSPSLTAELLVENDDGHYIYEKGRIWTASWQDVKGAFGQFYFPSETGGYYQPLTNLSFMLDAHLIGRDWDSRSFQFHFANILLHLLSVTVLFGLLRRLSGSTLWAFLLAAFFGLNPLQTASVAWVAQRMTLLGTLFSLLAIATYFRYGRTERIRWFFLVVLFYTAAVLAKPTFLVLPIVFLILDVWPLRRGQPSRPGPVQFGLASTLGQKTSRAKRAGKWRPISEKMPLFVLMAWSAALHFWLYTHVKPTGDAAGGGLTLFALNFVSFAKRMLWPEGLSPFYPTDVVASASTTGFHLVAGGVLTILFLAMLFWSFKRSRPLFVALAGGMILVLPAFMNLPFTTHLLRDPHLHIVWVMPLIALSTWIGTHKHRLLNRAPVRCGMAGLAAVVLLFAVKTYNQCFVWYDSRTLYAHAIHKYPTWPQGYVGLVQSYLKEPDYDAALKWAERAIKIAPDDPLTQFTLGRVLLLHEDGRAQEAIAPLRKALTSNPNWIDCLRCLGRGLIATGDPEEATVHLERARDMRPESPRIHTLLGEAYLQTNRPSSARKEYQLALKGNSTAEAEVHLGLARSWAMNDRADLAHRHLVVAVRQDSRFATIAAGFPELRSLCNENGFEGLIDISTTPPDDQDERKNDRQPRLDKEAPRGAMLIPKCEHVDSRVPRLSRRENIGHPHRPQVADTIDR